MRLRVARRQAPTDIHALARVTKHGDADRVDVDRAVYVQVPSETRTYLFRPGNATYIMGDLQPASQGPRTDAPVLDIFDKRCRRAEEYVLPARSRQMISAFAYA